MPLFQTSVSNCDIYFLLTFLDKHSMFNVCSRNSEINLSNVTFRLCLTPALQGEERNATRQLLSVTKDNRQKVTRHHRCANMLQVERGRGQTEVGCNL